MQGLEGKGASHPTSNINPPPVYTGVAIVQLHQIGFQKAIVSKPSAMPLVIGDLGVVGDHIRLGTLATQLFTLRDHTCSVTLVA